MSVEIIAELSNNANRDWGQMRRLIRAAKDCGADAIKVQCYTADELVALRGDGPAPEPWGNQGFTMRTLYEKAALPREWFPWIAECCASEVGIPWFSSVFGLESLALLESLGCPRYKIARLDNKDERLAEAVASTEKVFYVSEDSSYESAIVAGDKLRLYCPPGYPVAAADVHLPYDFDDMGFHGLSSHCLAPELPIAAVARGAKMLEYHFMLDNEPSELEANVSLGEQAFRSMVDAVRATERLLG